MSSFGSMNCNQASVVTADAFLTSLWRNSGPLFFAQLLKKGKGYLIGGFA